MERVTRYAAPLLLAATMLVAGSAPPMHSRTREALASLAEPEVLALLEDLFRRGGAGTRDIERAAFLVRRDDGTFDCLLWPFTGGFRSESFQGRVPDGTVAIVHTHPNTMIKASRQDRDTARTAGLPLFTVTWANISVVDPANGKEHWGFRRDKWSAAIPAATRETCRCREIGTPDPRIVGTMVATGK
ncbi:MAG: hypothetical protein ACRD2J_16795 [Thermoanaerobaculia bacterium]